MISAVGWVPRGAAKRNPSRYQTCEEEIEGLKEKALRHHAGDADDGDEEDDNDDEEVVAPGGGKAGGEEELDEHGLPKSLKMDEYDDEDDDEVAFVHAEEAEDEVDGESMDEEGEDEHEEDEDDEDAEEEEEAAEGLSEVLNANGGGMGMLPDAIEDDDNDSESDADDHEIRPTDAVVLVATTEDEEYSSIEVHVYEEETGGLYVHHDIALPAFPLCLAWGDCPSSLDAEGRQTGVGSYVAVGTFEPAIEIWDLDVIDPLEPVAVLGGERPPDKESKKKKKKSKRGAPPSLVPGSHEGAVMCLDWNRQHRQVLASGGADSVVKLWDVTKRECSLSSNHHDDKVVAVQWHPTEGTVLATGGLDRRLHVMDARSASSATGCQMKVSSDLESLAWDPHNPSRLFASTEDGSLVIFDVRNHKAGPLSQIRAHSKTLSSIAFSPKAPGLLATAGLDKAVKLWDVRDGAVPVQLGEKVMAAGKLFTLAFYPSSPFLLATGGDKGLLALWDLREIDTLVQRFGGKAEEVEEGVVESMEGMTVEEEEEEMAKGGGSGKKGKKETDKKKQKKKGKQQQQPN